MLIYHLSDSRGWYDCSIYRTKKEAIETAEHLMNQASWKRTAFITIHCMDTRTEVVKDVAITIHGVHRSETHDMYF